ncbi:MAG: hypothetical protein ACMG57_05665 [Candidatus Dojkabacteria bacterium]
MLTHVGLQERLMLESVEELLEIAEGKTLLLIPIAHGGIFSAFELLSHVQDKISPDSIVLPIRYSRRKNKDSNPIIPEIEIELIKDYIENKGAVVVIWDDDIVSANSITNFRRFIVEATHHDEFRIMGGYVTGNKNTKSDNTLNKQMIAESTLQLEQDQIK